MDRIQEGPFHDGKIKANAFPHCRILLTGMVTRTGFSVVVTVRPSSPPRVHTWIIEKANVLIRGKAEAVEERGPHRGLRPVPLGLLFVISLSRNHTAQRDLSPSHVLLSL